LTIANDFEDNVKRRAYGLQKPYFLLEGEQLRLQGTPVPRSPVQVSAAAADSAWRSPFPLHDFLDAHSALYAAVFGQLARIPALRRRWEAAELLYPQKTIYYSGQVGILRTKLSGEQAAAWRLTLALLDRWRAETERAGSRPVLLLVPSHLQVYPEVWERVVRQYDLAPGDWDPDYPNRRLREFCRAAGITLIDPLPELRQAASAGKAVYYKRNPHWNRAGHILAAQVAARELAALGFD
jgi:hypothetical protein